MNITTPFYSPLSLHDALPICPTVILPLLRQSKLKPRPAKILKWEGIIVDPVGVLLAVFAFEIVTYITADDPNGKSLLLFFGVAILAVIFGWLCGRILARSEERRGGRESSGR